MQMAPVYNGSHENQVKVKVTEYWQSELAKECLSLKSLHFFDPYKASLAIPHPMWTTTAGNSYEFVSPSSQQEWSVDVTGQI